MHSRESSSSGSAPTRAALAAGVGRLHILAIAALGTFTFGWLFTGHHPWLLAGVTAFDWFLVNLLNRVVDLAEDAQNALVGTDFVRAHSAGRSSPARRSRSSIAPIAQRTLTLSTRPWSSSSRPSRRRS